MTQITKNEELFIQVEGRSWSVASLSEASEKFCAVRDRMGVGASEMPPALLVNERGEMRFSISYNGKVWPHGPRDWKPGSVPAYDPYAN
ncbi:hypothetical protein [Nisaea sediminum]|uniref:hypothetical protein n=1 Tax=Nisaea sediminum TaxID=2775867 RepID=UPI001866D740|nr:hypothetical protein [Nisaea sediminum]